MGTKQILRALEKNELLRVYLASDTQAHIAQKVSELCKQCGTEVVAVPSMELLGRACHIEVSAAVAGVRKEKDNATTL